LKINYFFPKRNHFFKPFFFFHDLALRNIDDKARRPFWANLEGLAEEYQVILRNDRKYQR